VIFVSFDLQIGGLQMFFEHQKSASQAEKTICSIIEHQTPLHQTPHIFLISLQNYSKFCDVGSARWRRATNVLSASQFSLTNVYACSMNHLFVLPTHDLY
jgi:hypothetical protein